MVALENVLAHYGQNSSEKSGLYRKYICPFHGDTDPSFVISTSRDPSWAYCFGCGRSFGILDVVEHFEGVGRAEAIRIANDKWGCEFGGNGDGYKKTKADIERDERRALMEDLHKGFQQNMAQIIDSWIEAKGYPLKKEDVTRFKLGYLPSDRLDEFIGKYPGNYKWVLERMVGRVLFPVMTPNGDVLAFWGRKTAETTEKVPRNDVKNMYLPLTKNRDKFPYLLSHFRWGKPLMVVEAAADAMIATASLTQLSAIAAGGLIATLTPKTFVDAGLNPPSSIIFVPDPDMAGEMNLITNAPEIKRNWGTNAFVLELPSGMDLDEAIRVHGMGQTEFENVKSFDRWFEEQKGPGESLNQIIKSSAADVAAQAIEALTLVEMSYAQILNQANNLPEDERGVYLEDVRKAKGLKSVKHLLVALKAAMKESYLENPVETAFLHPAIDISGDGRVAVLGFQAEQIFLGKKELFNLYVVAKDDGSIECRSNDDSTWIDVVDGKEYRYAIDKSACDLPSVDNTWGKAAIADFVAGKSEELSPALLYRDILELYRHYVYLEHEEDFHLLTAYTIMTYFHRIFPAIPFLFLYGNKESGKSRTASVLQRLCFSAQIASRPSEAAMGDILDGFRGTLIIDQAEFLSLKQFEPVVNFLAGTYTQDTGRRAIVQIGGKTGRTIRHFDCFGPKIFGATRDPHVDLRDRLMVVPFMRPEDKSVLKDLKAPTASSEDWNTWRDKLYRLYLCHYGDLLESIQEMQGQDKSQNSKGRMGELIRPVAAIMKFCKVPEYFIGEIAEKVEQRIADMKLTITRLDEKILFQFRDVVRDKGGELVEVPIREFKKLCEETFETNLYEEAIQGILKRNSAYLKIVSKSGESILLTNLRTVEKSLRRLGYNDGTGQIRNGHAAATATPEAANASPYQITIHPTEYSPTRVC